MNDLYAPVEKITSIADEVTSRFSQVTNKANIVDDTSGEIQRPQGLGHLPQQPMNSSKFE